MKQVNLQTQLFWFRFCVISFMAVILCALLLSFAFSGKQDTRKKDEKETNHSVMICSPASSFITI